MKTKTTTMTKQKYKWVGRSFPVPADVVGAELARLEVKPGEFHRSADIMEEARDPNSALHGCFTWDDGKAADAHRLSEARGILRSISYVIVRGEEQTTRPVYLHLKDDDGPKYVRAERVASNRDSLDAAIHEALTALNGFKKRFAFLSELKPVFDAIGEVKKKRKK